MRLLAFFCDLCLSGDEELRLATARYWNDEGKEWHACNKHLEMVKELGLRHTEFQTKGGISL